MHIVSHKRIVKVKSESARSDFLSLNTNVLLSIIFQGKEKKVCVNKWKIPFLMNILYGKK